jgi:hypothetical protein
MAHERPCKLPKIQIDLWQVPPAPHAPLLDPIAFATKLCNNVNLLLLSILKCTRAQTIVEYNYVITLLHTDLVPRVHAGQIYMHDSWRIRYTDLPDDMQRAVSAQHHPETLAAAICNAYDATRVTEHLFTVLGPARTEGIHSLRALARLRE